MKLHGACLRRDSTATMLLQHYQQIVVRSADAIFIPVRHRRVMNYSAFTSQKLALDIFRSFR